MPRDIAACERSDCPRARTCFRFMQVRDPDYQTYLYTDKIGEACTVFAPIGDRDQRGWRLREVLA